MIISVVVTLPLLATVALLETARAAPSRCKALEEPLEGEMYSSRYDHVDVKAILNSERLLKNYVECVLDEGPCTAEGCFLRSVIPDALSRHCSRCTTPQKNMAGLILSFLLQNHRKTYWPRLLQKFDPDGIFRSEHEFEDDEDSE